jgi:hypothetical protein
MQPCTQAIEVERSGHFEEEFFSIGDTGLVLEILRKKTYSDLLAAFIREIPCNARDANREVGKWDVPIRIKLPWTGSPTFEVSDEGLGISRSRMYDVFIKVGRSTKRTDARQTGGFGIGAKTPFAYVNAFTVDTTALEPDGLLWRSVYSLYIDETKQGKLALISRNEATEPTGTKVIIPILEEDFSAVRNTALKHLQYWSVAPLIEQQDGVQSLKDLLPEAKQLSEFAGKVAKIYQNTSGDENKLNVLVDEMFYPVKLPYLNVHGFNRNIADRYNITEAQYQIVTALLDNSLLLAYENHEMPVAANREQLEYTKETELKIIADILAFADNYFKHLDSEYVKHNATLHDSVDFLWRTKKSSETLFAAYAKQKIDTFLSDPEQKMKYRAEVENNKNARPRIFTYKHYNVYDIVMNNRQLAFDSLFDAQKYEHDGKQYVLHVNKTKYEYIGGKIKRHKPKEMPIQSVSIVVRHPAAKKIPYLAKIHKLVEETRKPVIFFDVPHMQGVTGNFAQAFGAAWDKVFDDGFVKEFNVIDISSLPEIPKTYTYRGGSQVERQTGLYGYTVRHDFVAKRVFKEDAIKVYGYKKKNRALFVSADDKHELTSQQAASRQFQLLNLLQGKTAVEAVFVTPTIAKKIQDNTTWVDWPKFIVNRFREDPMVRRKVMRFLLRNTTLLIFKAFRDIDAMRKLAKEHQPKAAQLCLAAWHAENIDDCSNTNSHAFKKMSSVFQQPIGKKLKKHKKVIAPLYFGFHTYCDNSDQKYIFNLLLEVLQGTPEVKKLNQLRRDCAVTSGERMLKIAIEMADLLFHSPTWKRYHNINATKIYAALYENRAEIIAGYLRVRDAYCQTWQQVNEFAEWYDFVSCAEPTKRRKR